MCFDMRKYTIYPGILGEYMSLFESVGLPIRKRYAQLVGYCYTEIGALNQVIHIWWYDSLDDRIIVRKKLYLDSKWPSDLLPFAMTMLEKQENNIMCAARFSPIF